MHTYTSTCIHARANTHTQRERERAFARRARTVSVEHGKADARLRQARFGHQVAEEALPHLFKRRGRTLVARGPPEGMSACAQPVPGEMACVTMRGSKLHLKKRE
eukprot:6188080-Pleurochrysis_carterae.AAC.3